MLYPRIDRGREVLLVPGGFVEAAPDLAPEFRIKLRRSLAPPKSTKKFHFVGVTSD